MSDFTVGLLSTLDNPLLPFFIHDISKLGNIRMIIICDQKLISSKDNHIWNERTGGYFENQNISIYDFCGQLVSYYFINHNSESLIELINCQNIDCLLNAGTPRKLQLNIINSTRFGVLNIHPGALPDYRGCSAVEWSIYNNDAVANTAHFMDAEYDTGPIFKIERYTFSLDDTYVSIRCKVLEAGCKLAASVLSEISLNTSSSLKLTHQFPSEGQYFSPISNENLQKVISILETKSYRFMS